MTGEGLNFNIANIVSNEIRSDRQITDLVQVDAEAAGPINIELSYAAYDLWMEAALFSDATWSTPAAVAEIDIDAAAGDNSFNTAAGDFLVDGVTPGMWLDVSGFTDTTLNIFHRVVSVVAGKIIVDTVPTIATEAAGASVVMENDGVIWNGVLEQSFTLEKAFTDKTQFHAFAGCVVSAMTLNLNVQEILTGSFEFMGKDMVRDVTTAGTAFPYTAAPANQVMNAVANVQSVREGLGQVVSPIFIRTVTATLSNNLRGIKAISFLGNVDIGVGRGQVTGTMQVYFEDGAMVDKYIAGTETSLDFRVSDAAGNKYVVTFPRIKIISQEIVAGAIDQDVVLDMEWQAIRETANDRTMQIDRFTV
jgi:hypothetical protein